MKMYVGFPVEIPSHEFGETRYPGLHITLAYWPEVTAKQCNAIADWIAGTSVYKMFLNEYHILNNKSWYPDLFGPDEDIPVLRLSNTARGWHEIVNALRDDNSTERMSHLFDAPSADITYKWNAHITVPLKLAMKQPNNFIIRPIHMWRGNRDPHPIVRSK
jgi:hypothetical protein